EMVNAFQDAKSSGEDIPTAARTAGLKFNRIAALDRSGLAPDGTRSAAPTDAEFLSNVFSVEVGEEHDPVAAQSGAYYAIRVNGVTPPKVKPLDEVRAAVAADWLDDKRRTLLAARVKELTDQAQ